MVGDGVELRRELAVVGVGVLEVAVGEEPISNDLLRRANELRTMGLFRHFSDELLIPLAKIVVPGEADPNHTIFTEGEATREKDKQ